MKHLRALNTHASSVTKKTARQSGDPSHQDMISNNRAMQNA